MSESGLSLPPLVTRLMDPACYPGSVRDVKLIETHISYVLLAGEYAYKIKKPVDLGFLDFSTLEKRQHCCLEEVRLNRRLAPSLYLGVVGIGGTEAAPQLDAGEPIEYAVQMRRFEQSAQLDRLLAAGRLEPAQLDAFAGLLADFHGQAAVAAQDSPFGTETAVYAPVAENFRALRAALPGGNFAAQLDALEAASMTSFLALRDRFAERKQRGRVRECHGDLHLRNMAWIDDQPVAFDCIEFSPALRWIDVMSDVAFLTMDLHARAEPGMAARFLNLYLEEGGDYVGVALLSFYQAYRAMVRAKVDAIRLGQADLEQSERLQIEAECRRYLELAAQYGKRRAPWLMITRGPSGSGKTTLTEGLVEELGAIRIRSDVERKRLFGLRAGQSGAAEPGSGIYTSAAGRETYQKLLELAAGLLAAGVSVIVDAVFADDEQRGAFAELAGGMGLPYLIAEFAAPDAVLLERVRARSGDASDADAEVLAQQLRGWQPVSESERGHLHLIDTAMPVDTARLARELKRRLAGLAPD